MSSEHFMCKSDVQSLEMAENTTGDAIEKQLI